jgi:hypothetical protein
MARTAAASAESTLRILVSMTYLSRVAPPTLDDADGIRQEIQDRPASGRRPILEQCLEV